MKNLKVGDKVKIYSDPFTQEDLEGEATLMDVIIPLDEFGHSQWGVHFDGDDPGEVYSRLIDEREEFDIDDEVLEILREGRENPLSRKDAIRMLSKILSLQIELGNVEGDPEKLAEEIYEKRFRKEGLK